MQNKILSISGVSHKTSGVITVTGQGVSLRVRRHQLEITDGFPLEAPQETRRITRATSRVERILITAGSGWASLSVWDWCAENGIPVVAVDQGGEPRWTLLPGKGGEWQAALRRAAALIPFTETGAEIAQWIVQHKIKGQRDVLRELTGRLSHLPRDAWPQTALPGATATLEALLPRVERTESIIEVRKVEAVAGAVYWSGLCGLPLHFAPPSYKKRVPGHWLTFAGRGSPLTGGPRHAVDPCNALFSYAYALLATEALLATHQAGLDPYLDVCGLHTDRDTRRSLVYSVIEPVRPVADRLVLTFLLSHAFRPGELWPLRDGRCRLDQDLCARLWPWMPEFRRALGPVMTFLLSRLRQGPKYGERVAYRLVEVPPPVRTRAPLGQKRWAHESSPPPIRPAGVCPSCGVLLEGQPDRLYCNTCAPVVLEANREKGREELRQRRKAGVDPAHGGKAARARGRKIGRANRERARWRSATPGEARPDVFRREILPGLRRTPLRLIARATGISEGYASFIRRGLRIPHARHWAALVALAKGGDAMTHS